MPVYVSFRLVRSLHAALRGAGPVGYLLWPDRVLSLAALHLRPGRLSYKLVYFDPAAAALPGDSLLGVS